MFLARAPPPFKASVLGCRMESWTHNGAMQCYISARINAKCTVWICSRIFICHYTWKIPIFFVCQAAQCYLRFLELIFISKLDDPARFNMCCVHFIEYFNRNLKCNTADIMMANDPQRKPETVTCWVPGSFGDFDLHFLCLNTSFFEIMRTHADCTREMSTYKT